MTSLGHKYYATKSPPLLGKKPSPDSPRSHSVRFFVTGVDALPCPATNLKKSQITDVSFFSCQNLGEEQGATNE